jgi:hypothetical protein
MGDFIWLEEGQEIPDITGTAYVSVSYKNVFNSIVDKAIRNPNLKLVLGGPAFTKYFKPNVDISNLIIMRDKRVEELFDIEYNPDNWGLEIPPGFDNVGYDFSLVRGKGCWWGKCIFCKWADHLKSNDYGVLPYKEIPVIDYPGNKYIWLNSASMFPEDIIKVYSNLPNRTDVYYSSYIRGDEKTYEALEKALCEADDMAKQMVFALGVELPERRLLSYVKKGTTPEILLKTIKLLLDKGCLVNLNFILGWPELTWDNAYEISDWFSNLNGYNNLTAILYRLMIIDDRPIYTMSDRPIALMSSMNGTLVYKYILNEEQIKINEFIRTSIHNCFGERLIDNYDSKNVYNKRDVERKRL